MNLNNIKREEINEEIPKEESLENSKEESSEDNSKETIEFLAFRITRFIRDILRAFNKDDSFVKDISSYVYIDFAYLLHLNRRQNVRRI